MRSRESSRELLESRRLLEVADMVLRLVELDLVVLFAVAERESLPRRRVSE
jgi:RecA/RadA recombinase